MGDIKIGQYDELLSDVGLQKPFVSISKFCKQMLLLTKLHAFYNKTLSKL